MGKVDQVTKDRLEYRAKELIDIASKEEETEVSRLAWVLANTIEDVLVAITELEK